MEEFRKDLDTLQRKMVRYVLCRGFGTERGGLGQREHVGDDDVWALGWMPFHRVDFFKAMHVFKIRKSTAPSYISEHFKPISEIHSHG